MCLIGIDKCLERTKHEAQDVTKNVNGDCCMRQIYGRAGKKMTEPKGFFWHKGFKNTKRCRNQSSRTGGGQRK